MGFSGRFDNVFMNWWYFNNFSAILKKLLLCLLVPNNFLKTMYQLLQEKIFLIHRDQILFFNYELFKLKWKSKIDTCRKQVFLCCWVMIMTLRNTFIVFDSKLMIITSVKRWEHFVPEFEKTID